MSCRPPRGVEPPNSSPAHRNPFGWPWWAAQTPATWPGSSAHRVNTSSAAPDVRCSWRESEGQRRLAGGPFLGAVELVEPEHGELTGDHPGHRVHDMGDPVLVGH